MKVSASKIKGNKDDSLYGLLSPYKSNTTYFRVLVSEDKHCMEVQLADNPQKFFTQRQGEKRDYRPLKRLEMGITKASLKYLTPEYLVSVMGPMLGISIPPDKVSITHSLKKDGYYGIETFLKYKSRVLQGVKKLVNMSPQKRYEILEKYFSA